VEVKHIGYEDYQSKGKSQAEDDMVFLIPLEGTSRDCLFARWLPDVAGSHTEVAAFLPSPVSGLARLALMRRDHRSPENHYLFVMTKGAEEDLKNHHGREMEIDIFGEEHDALLDRQKDFALAGKKDFAAT
jgi:hypothetical protein